jgi:CelD/BcsL family acetyltransferase involved in cellulose biosynthesis
MISPREDSMTSDFWDLQIETDFDRCADTWQAFEVDATATPYQSHAWISSWWNHVEMRESAQPCTVMLRRNGRLAAIIPLVMRRHMGARIAGMIGGKHFNYQAPVWRPEMLDDAARDAMPQTLRVIARTIGADLIEVTNLPREWRGQVNPLALKTASECPSPSYMLPLSGSFAEICEARRSKKSLQQLRRKRKKLEGLTGSVRFMQARDEATCAMVLRAAAAHRAARRAASGVPSFFETPGSEAFLRECASACITAEGHGNMSSCAVRLHYLQAGDTVVATYIGAALNGVYSCFVNSFDTAFEACSPGDILLHDLIESLCEEDFHTFDLGVGEERYKKAWCDPVPLYDLRIPITPRGWIYSNAARVSQDGKRLIKQNPMLWRGWRSMRRLASRKSA